MNFKEDEQKIQQGQILRILHLFSNSGTVTDGGFVWRFLPYWIKMTIPLLLLLFKLIIKLIVIIRIIMTIVVVHKIHLVFTVIELVSISHKSQFKKTVSMVPDFQ